MATPLTSAQENHAYSQALTAVGAQGPLTPDAWEVDAFGGTLPPGLLLNTTTGVISGTPTAGSFGTYSFTIILEDAIGTTCSKDYSIRVRPDPFANILWTTITAHPDNGVAAAAAVGESFDVYVAAAALPAESPFAQVYGSLTYNNTTGSPILCNLECETYGAQYLVYNGAGNNWRIVTRTTPAPPVSVVNDFPVLNTGWPNQTDNFPFTLAIGNNVLSVIQFRVAAAGQAPPSLVHGAQGIRGTFQVL